MREKRKVPLSTGPYITEDYQIDEAKRKENPAPDSNRERGKKVLTNDRQYLTLLLYEKTAARVKAGKMVKTVTLQMGKVPEIWLNLESGVITFVLPSLDEPQTMKALIEAARAHGWME